MPTLSNISAVLAVAAAGALIAYLVYRRTTKRKVHDLSAELRAEQESLRATLEALRAKIDLAKRSRAAFHRAGNTGPQALQNWLGELDRDLSEVDLLQSQLAAADSGYKALSDMDVDINLVEILALSLRASELAEKYGDSNFPQEMDRETLADDAEALIGEAPRYSLSNSGSSIAESVV